MIQKENQAIKVSNSRKNRKGVSTKETGQANDYILKRYKLQQNKLFRQKQNDELRYEVKHQENIKEVEEDFEDELVIVPMELPGCIQQDNPSQVQSQKEQKNLEIFVFDEDQDSNYQNINEGININSQNTSFAYDSSLKTGQNISPQQLSAKPTLRDNWSAAQLITPQPRQFHKNKNEGEPYQGIAKILKRQDQGQSISQEEGEQHGIQHLKGVKVSKQLYNKNVSITITDKKVFGMSKLPTGIILKCIIKRTSSFLNLMSPQFDLYLANGLKHILSAKKYPLRNRQLFKFSINPLKFDQANQIAVMHANVNHNIYWVLDQPRRMGNMDLSLIYLVIGYYKLKSEEKQRKFTALLPPNATSQYQLAMDYELSSINFGNMKEEITTEISNLPKWKNQNCNSTKNFVLADEDDPDYRYLQMKKEGDDVFELTIQHPFSPLQAMAIAMTRFDAQLK